MFSSPSEIARGASGHRATSFRLSTKRNAKGSESRQGNRKISPVRAESPMFAGVRPGAGGGTSGGRARRSRLGEKREGLVFKPDVIGPESTWRVPRARLDESAGLSLRRTSQADSVVGSKSFVGATADSCRSPRHHPCENLEGIVLSIQPRQSYRVPSEKGLAAVAGQRTDLVDPPDQLGPGPSDSSPLGRRGAATRNSGRRHLRDSLELHRRTSPGRPSSEVPAATAAGGSREMEEPLRPQAEGRWLRLGQKVLAGSRSGLR